MPCLCTLVLWYDRYVKHQAAALECSKPVACRNGLSVTFCSSQTLVLALALPKVDYAAVISCATAHAGRTAIMSMLCFALPCIAATKGIHLTRPSKVDETPAKLLLVCKALTALRSLEFTIVSIDCISSLDVLSTRRAHRAHIAKANISTKRPWCSLPAAGAVSR
jgi:hypothetical protein